MPPTKKEIREKYGIAEEDFSILEEVSLPSPQQLLDDKASITKLGFWNKFEVWKKTSIIGGILIAIIFIGEIKDGLDAIKDIGLFVYANTDEIAYYTSHFADYSKELAKGLLAHTDSPPTEEDKERAGWAILPTGVQLFPVLGSWKPSLEIKI